MKDKRKPENNVMPEKVAASFTALKRAAQRAKEVAKRTQTPLIIVENGQLKQIQL